MPVRKPATERQRRLGAELRKMRERAGLTINEAAVMHRTDRTTVSNVESGRFGVSADRVRVWAANYSCHEAPYIDALAEMARERRAGAADHVARRHKVPRRRCSAPGRGQRLPGASA
ncbi:helix-turn-helix domain-containing protein [Streptomyces xinghaiensis]|uniref:helix-turn-helix domain-containing protein n=1 Tax=Streptomyces xinghaiensis TaxID=1038928 RepID=UPI000BAFF6F3|nr:helix-turn-helix domain-containing protein [Streptomyces sp. SID5475]